MGMKTDQQEKDRLMASTHKEEFEGLKEEDEEMHESDHQSKINQQQEGLGASEDHMRLRVTKSRASELNHAKCILNL